MGKIERLATILTALTLLLGSIGALVATWNYFRRYVADLKAETREAKALVGTAKLNLSESARLSSLETNSAQSVSQLQSQLAALALYSSSLGSNVSVLKNRIIDMEK